MLSPKRRLSITVLLFVLVLLDVAYAVVAIGFPDVWFRSLHASSYVDPAGLLRRTGAIWAAFALVQLVALLKWKKRPSWLAVAAGTRLGELFADWAYLFFATSLTASGRLGLSLSTPLNALVCLFLLDSYWKLERGPAVE